MNTKNTENTIFLLCSLMPLVFVSRTISNQEATKTATTTCQYPKHVNNRMTNTINIMIDITIIINLSIINKIIKIK